MKLQGMIVGISWIIEKHILGKRQWDFYGPQKLIQGMLLGQRRNNNDKN